MAKTFEENIALVLHKIDDLRLVRLDSFNCFFNTCLTKNYSGIRSNQRAKRWRYAWPHVKDRLSRNIFSSSRSSFGDAECRHMRQ